MTASTERSPRTLILHPRYDEDSQALWQAAVQRGWPVERLDYRLGGSSWSTVPANLAADVAIYGGYMWAEHVATLLSRKLMSPPADWLTTLPERFTRRRIAVSTVGEVRRGSHGFPVFVKSLHGKQLASRVYASPDDLPDVGDEVQVLAQQPVEWSFEYRCFVDWQGIRAVSSYAVRGELEIGLYPDYASVVSVPELMNPLLAQQLAPQNPELLGTVMPCVIDVGCIEGVGMAVVEANPAWCSAVYGCDPRAVLDVVAASCASARRATG